VALSMFSAIFVTRTLLQAIIGSPWVHNPVLFGADVPDTRPAPAASGRLRLGQRGAGS
jgi:hypothetical protein